MEEDVEKGWWSVPPAETWKCPRCHCISSVIDWREVEPYCEDCGYHDGRECPSCKEVFDFVWDIDELKEANELKTT